MRIRTTLVGATIALTAAAGTFGASTQADAQTNLLGLLQVVNGSLATADCDAVKLALRGTQLVDDTTTRGELVNKLTDKTKTDPTFAFATAPTVNALADRALECKVVKADPVTPEGQALKLSSELSSKAGLPEARNLAPVVQSLSSQK